MEDLSRATELFIAGLKNAHAMESQALAIMRPQVGRIENYPEVKAKLEQHIGETEEQINRLEHVLEDCGTAKSALKDATLSIAGTMAALGHAPAEDEILKNTFANFAFENYEAAAYKSLIAIGREAGKAEALEPLQQNLDEELAMAAWLEENLEVLTSKFVTRFTEGETAKK
jgi:ferritin-like metal-binding protein YciE